MTAAEWTPASWHVSVEPVGRIRLGRGGRGGCSVWEVEETEAMMSAIFFKI